MAPTSFASARSASPVMTSMSPVSQVQDDESVVADPSYEEPPRALPAATIARQLIRRVSRNDTLFTWITYGNPRTKSPLEGDINAQIRELLRRHRGMSEQHHRRAVE